MMMTNPFEISDAFRTMCKIAVESGLSRTEMDNAVAMAWLLKEQAEEVRWEKSLSAHTERVTN